MKVYLPGMRMGCHRHRKLLAPELQLEKQLGRILQVGNWLALDSLASGHLARWHYSTALDQRVSNYEMNKILHTFETICFLFTPGLPQDVQ